MKSSFSELTPAFLVIKASTAKEIKAVGVKTDRRRILARIQALSANPRPQGSEKLAGHTEGSYRIVYRIDDGRREEVTIFKVGHRKDVYRSLSQRGRVITLPMTPKGARRGRSP